MEGIAAEELGGTFRCWMCGEQRSVLDQVLEIDLAQVCGDCAELN